MRFLDCRADLPVTLIYDLDPFWPLKEIHARKDAVRVLTEALLKVGHPVEELCIQSADLTAALQRINPEKRIILNWCEELPGIPQSESQVAQILEEMGFIFTGTGSHAISLSENKGLVKQLLHEQGVSTPNWQVFHSSESMGWDRFPAIVKAAFSHCSYGITRESVVLTTAELEQRTHFVLETLHQPALVEDFLDGREFHVGVIGNEKLLVLPPGEIDFSAFSDIHDRLCTYESNVDPDSLAYQLTAPKMQVNLSKQQHKQLKQIVVKAYHATGCRDYARMDIRLHQGIFHVLDVNPNPDISADTSFALGAEMAGISYGMLGSILVNLAARRHPTFG